MAEDVREYTAVEVVLDLHRSIEATQNCGFLGRAVFALDYESELFLGFGGLAEPLDRKCFCSVELERLGTDSIREGAGKNAHPD